MQKLASVKWKELITAPRHGCGTEFIPASQIKVRIPPQFEDQERFMVFRYDGLLPIEPKFGQLYDHD